MSLSLSGEGFNANESSIKAVDNTVSNFSGPAIIVKKPSAPAHVLGNVAFSDQAKDAVVSIDGTTNKALDNKLVPAAGVKDLPTNPACR